MGYPHLNECVNSLEILNIGGSNVLGEFIPFLFLHTPKLKSLGQWLNTMIYGLEILKVLNMKMTRGDDFYNLDCFRTCRVILNTRTIRSRSSATPATGTTSASPTLASSRRAPSSRT